MKNNFCALSELKNAMLALAILAGAFACFESHGQFSGFTVNRKSGGKRSAKPTKVNADAMDIDINNNKIILLGNVEVDDPEMNIKCRKMIIFLENSKKSAPDANARTGSPKTGKKQSSGGIVTMTPSEKSGNGPGDDSGKQVSRIECYGDVVITRISDSKKPDDVQKAYAGEAVYQLSTETIELKDKPVLARGTGDRIAGQVIRMNTKTGRVIISYGKAMGMGGLLSGGGSGGK